jgi:hypothetical protein
MSKYHFYGVKDGAAWHIVSPRPYRIEQWYHPQLFSHSDLVWQQGPKGGVKFILENWALCNGVKFRKHGYITTDDEAMKEFMWVKLTATDLNK